MIQTLWAAAVIASTGTTEFRGGELLETPRAFEINWFGEPPRTEGEPEAVAGGAERSGEEHEGRGDEVRPGFGSAGSRWLTAGAAAAYDFDEDYDLNLHLSCSLFVADRLELGVEGAGWYFNQVGQDTGGVSGMFVLRYHFWSGPNGDFDWSAFVDAGTGLLVGFDEVPDGGTGFNFIQRAGLGMTKDLDASDGTAHGARLVFGIRWHHISNGRFEGDSRNPSRDSILGFVGVSWDF